MGEHSIDSSSIYRVPESGTGVHAGGPVPGGGICPRSRRRQTNSQLLCQYRSHRRSIRYLSRVLLLLLAVRPPSQHQYSPTIYTTRSRHGLVRKTRKTEAPKLPDIPKDEEGKGKAKCNSYIYKASRSSITIPNCNYMLDSVTLDP